MKNLIKDILNRAINKDKVKTCSRKKIPIITLLAFTLAEVLIVMSIIGIVAEITIPSLAQSVEESKYVTGLKKSYSGWNQALQQLSSDNGCLNDLKCTGLFASTTTDSATFGQAIIRYFQVAKDCGVGTTGCWAPSLNRRYDGKGTTNSGGTSWAGLAGYYEFTTKDGMAFMFNNYANDCAASTATGYLTQNCGSLMVDINGLQKPNRLGRDIFRFYISNGKGPMLYPWGGSEFNGWSSNNYCGGATSTDSDWCAGRIMEQNWEMKY